MPKQTSRSSTRLTWGTLGLVLGLVLGLALGAACGWWMRGRSAPVSSAPSPAVSPAALSAGTATRSPEPEATGEPEVAEGVRKEIIVVSERDKNETLQLFIREIDGSDPTQLTFNENKSWMPAISPDGEKVAYVVDAKTSLNIYLINLDGTENQQLTFGGLNITPCWTPDGEHLLYAHSPAPHKTPVRLYKIDADGKNKKMLLDKKGKHWEMVPTISPDGKEVAFTSNRSGDGKYEIWKVKMDGSGLTRLTTVGYDDDIKANIQQKVPAWSPDGSRIALWRGVEMTELKKDGGERDRKIFQSWKVCVMNSDGTNLTAIDFGDDPTCSNDGKYILHPDPINRDQNRPGVISVKIHFIDGGDNRTLFRTRKDFGRMDVGFMNAATKQKK